MTKDEALKKALAALEGVHQDSTGWWDYHVEITAIKEALAQPEQEPWCMKMNSCKTKCEDCPDEPAQRTWVELTATRLKARTSLPPATGLLPA